VVAAGPSVVVLSPPSSAQAAMISASTVTSPINRELTA
jgi:hypothetical protein